MEPNSFMEQKTATLVFGIAGRIGSGASFITTALMEELKVFGYKTVKIRITEKFLEPDSCCSGNLESNANSHNIIQNILKVISSEEQSGQETMSDKALRIKKMQDKGNKLREKYGNDILAALTTYLIVEDSTKKEENRCAYIIDSLKHPDEVSLLRTVFQGAFCMIGAVANDSVRKRRLQAQKQITGDEFNKISKIDAGEENKNGQQTTKTILESDYFFENNYDTPDKINQECKRLLYLLFQSTIVTPRQDEYGMHLAFASADKSACLSRQVGAAIISESGNILATGHNDVPKFGFDNYGGVSPKKYAELFSMHKDRKDNGEFRRILKEESEPLNAQESVTLESRLQKFKDWFDNKFSE